MTPIAQTSTAFPYFSFLITSGDRYPGVPANPKYSTLSFTVSTASPKSANFIAAPVDFDARSRFSGFKSKMNFIRQ